MSRLSTRPPPSPLAVGSPSLGSSPRVLGLLPGWPVPVPTPASPAPVSPACHRASRCQIALPAASSLGATPHPAPVPSATRPHSPALPTGAADPRPSQRNRMEGPVLTLGLLAALVVCGKSGHHPSLEGPSGPLPRSPTACSPPVPSYVGLPLPVSGPPPHFPLPFLPGGANPPGPAPGPAGPQGGVLPGPLSPTLPRQLGPERGGAADPAPV